MTTIQVPTREQVAPKAQTIFDNLQKGLGMVPNIYATIGYSEEVLAAYLQYSQAIGGTTFSKKETEAIKLAISEVNGCEYCTAAHTALAKMNGFSDTDTIAIRQGNYQEARLNTIITTAQEIARQKGAISATTTQAFFELGYGPEALIDLIATVNVVSFTNFIHNATKIPVDFPAAPALESQAI